MSKYPPAYCIWRSGQVSLEFTMLVSILLILLLGTIYYNSAMWIQMVNTKANNDGQRITNQVSSEINLGLGAGDGYSRSFFIPGKISDTFDYNVTIKVNLVYLNWTSGSAQSVIQTENATGKILKGNNMLRNINGTIRIN